MITNLLQRAGCTETEKGFTLFELLVVSILLAIMLTISVPAFRTTLLTDQLRQAGRLVVGSINEVRRKAAGSKSGCYLNLNISENQITYDCPDKRSQKDSEELISQEDTPQTTKLPDSVSVSSVWTGKDQSVTAGTTSIWINNNGLMNQTIINLTDGDRDLAVVTSVFKNDIRLEEKSLTPEDLNQQ